MTVPLQQPLERSVEEGWESLCDFLRCRCLMSPSQIVLPRPLSLHMQRKSKQSVLLVSQLHQPLSNVQLTGALSSFRCLLFARSFLLGGLDSGHLPQDPSMSLLFTSAA